MGDERPSRASRYLSSIGRVYDKIGAGEELLNSLLIQQWLKF